MRASRRRACSSDSSTRMPPPSPHTKPSRPASNGRDAFCGWSLRVDIAFIEQKPAIVSGTTIASAPPAILPSESPRWMIRIEPPRVLLVDVLELVEVADLAGDARDELVLAVRRLGLGVELRDRADARLALHERRPELFDGVAHRRERAETRDDDAAGAHG